MSANHDAIWTFDDNKPEVDVSVAALRLDVLRLARQTLTENGDECTADDVVAAAGKYMAFVHTPSVQQAVEKVVADSLATLAGVIFGGARQ